MWEQIRSNRIRSAWVVVGMGVILVGTGMALGGAFGSGDPTALVFGGVVALAVWFVMWLFSMRGGDQVMLRMAGAKEIEKKDHPQLWNVVEEMAIASSLGMPKVYIVDDPSPNAFATGRRSENAAVAVTTGLLRVCNRDELQGVVAHELGHIKNRDVALMVTAGVMMGAIVLLAEVGLRAMWYGGGRRSRSSGKGGGAEAVTMIVAIVLLVLAPILAQLIYFALSRRREYLADASGALFTRYPEGLASALEKISGTSVPLADKSRVTAPMYIVRPLREGEARQARRSRRAAGLTATHPPVESRVRILRAMGGGADFRTYERAYHEVTGQRSELIGAQTLAAAAPVPAMAATAGGGVGEGVGASSRERGRQASDAFLSASGYERRTCPSCGAILKIPSEFVGRVNRCPRCRTAVGAGSAG